MLSALESTYIYNTIYLHCFKCINTNILRPWRRGIVSNCYFDFKSGFYIFSFPRSGDKIKRGVELRHSKRDVCKIRVKKECVLL